MTLGGAEAWNHARLKAYLQNVGSPLANGSDICTCDTLTAEVLGDEPYTTPDDPGNEAPWYDADVPDSADFLGILVLDIEGIDDFPVARSVTNAVVGGGSIGAARVRPRTLTVSALVIGVTCCGVSYGLKWFKSVLQGCAQQTCGGDCATLYDCCPEEGLTAEQFNARYRRTLRRVALTSGPVVTGRAGGGDCNNRCGGADVVEIEFTLTAATPWLFGDETEFLNVDLPRDTSDDCIEWCAHNGTTGNTCDGEPCFNSGCSTDTDPCADPECVAPSPPVPTTPDICGCTPLSTIRECYALDFTSRPAYIEDVPMIRVYAGSSDMRHVTISLYAKPESDAALTCDQIADKYACEPAGQWEISFLKSGSELTLDGQVGRALVECNKECSSATTIFGFDGGPVEFPVIDCKDYCLCITSDSLLPPAADATLSFSVSGRNG
jgi:hypothetical protein